MVQATPINNVNNMDAHLLHTYDAPPPHPTPPGLYYCPRADAKKNTVLRTTTTVSTL